MTERFDLLVAGRPSVDLMFTGLQEWPSLGRDIEASGLGVCAGTSFNTPAAANRVGLRVALAANLGNDMWSRMIRDEFEFEGLSTEFLAIDEHPLPGVSVAINLHGERGFVTHWAGDEEYGERAAAHELTCARTVDARHLHAYVDLTRDLEQAAHDRGMTISVDSWGGPAWASSRPLAEVLAHANVLFANQAEATAMTGETDVVRALDRLGAHCDCVVIKRGGTGAVGLAGGQMKAVPAEPVQFVDSTGAGDCFNAGFLAGWLSGLPLEDSLTLGVICGSASVGDYGGYRGCPDEATLRAVAAARGISLPAWGVVSEGDAT